MFTEFNCQVLTWHSGLSRKRRLVRQLDLTIASKRASLKSAQIAAIASGLTFQPSPKTFSFRCVFCSYCTSHEETHLNFPILDSFPPTSLRLVKQRMSLCQGLPVGARVHSCWDHLVPIIVAIHIMTNVLVGQFPCSVLVWSQSSKVAMLKRSGQPQRTGRPVLDASSSTRQLGCVFQDVEPPKSSSILRSDTRKPIRCVKFTKAFVRHADIRNQNPSLGMICPGDPQKRNPIAPKFEDRSQEETEWQERCAREAAWRLAESILKLKGEKAAFFSPSESWCLPAPSNLEPEEREFVVDSWASMHMISKKDLNSVEMNTLTKSCSPTTVITPNWEVQTHEEATVYVKELDIFSTMKVLENTPAVLSIGKLCDEHGYSYEWISGQKPHLIKNGFRIQCNTENFVPTVVPGLSSSSSDFPTSTSMTPSRQERNHPTSSSSSSTSPPMTSSTVSSDSETREREDLCGTDSYPAPVSSEHVERKERRDPSFALDHSCCARKIWILATFPILRRCQSPYHRHQQQICPCAVWTNRVVVHKQVSLF